jgi:hypothetical protein
MSFNVIRIRMAKTLTNINPKYIEVLINQSRQTFHMNCFLCLKISGKTFPIIFLTAMQRILYICELVQASKKHENH